MKKCIGLATVGILASGIALAGNLEKPLVCIAGDFYPNGRVANLSGADPTVIVWAPERKNEHAVADFDGKNVRILFDYTGKGTLTLYRLESMISVAEKFLRNRVFDLTWATPYAAPVKLEDVNGSFNFETVPFGTTWKSSFSVTLDAASMSGSMISKFEAPGLKGSSSAALHCSSVQ